MSKSFFLFLAGLGVCVAVLAQDADSDAGAARGKAGGVKPADKPGFVPTAAPAATPEPKAPGVLQRIFGSRQKRTLFPTTPTPESSTPASAKAKTPLKSTAEATPTPKKRRPKTKPAEEAEPAKTNAETPEATKAPVEKPAPSTPAPTKKSRKGKGAPVATPPDAGEPPAGADPEVKEQFRFDRAKAQASEDPEVKELKAKADGAATEEEARAAQRAYNRALFGKMRKLDGSLEERVNQMEAAILKRLDGK